MQEKFDLLIRNATIIDGTRAPRFAGDIGMRGDRIARIGDLDRPRTASVEIDAARPHRGARLHRRAHARRPPDALRRPTWRPRSARASPRWSPATAASRWRRCRGGMRAPVPPPLDLLDDEGGWFRFPTFASYVEELRRASPRRPTARCWSATRRLRVATMDDLDRPATHAEIARMRDTGATRRSRPARSASRPASTTSRRVAAPTEEVIEICRPLERAQALYCTHMRDEGDQRDRLAGRDLPHRPRARRAGGDLAPQGGRARANHGRSQETLPHHREARCARSRSASTAIPYTRLLDHPLAPSRAAICVDACSSPGRSRIPSSPGMDLDEIAKKMGLSAERGGRAACCPPARSTSRWTRPTCSASSRSSTP